MTDTYSSARIAHFNTLLKERNDIINGRLWMIQPKGLRFKHGESIAELKVPYHMGAEDETLIEQAVEGLISLFTKRYDAKTAAKMDSTQLKNTAHLKDRTYRTDIFIEGSSTKGLATKILNTTPFIDSGILVQWLSPEGPGTVLIKWLDDIFEKTIRDEAQQGGEEKTVDLLMLAMVRTIRKKKERLKEVRIAGFGYDKLDIAVGFTLFACVRHTLVKLSRRMSDICAPSYNPLTEVLLQTAPVPKAFLSIASNMLSVAFNPYGINSSSAEIISTFATEISESTKDLSSLIESTIKRIRSDKQATETLRMHKEVVNFRSAALDYMMEFETPGVEPQTTLYSIYDDDKRITRLIEDPKAMAELADSLDKAHKKVARGSQRGEVIERFSAYLLSFKKSMLSGLLKGSKKETIISLNKLVEGYYTFKLDEHIERFRGLMRSYLADRRGEFSTSTLKEEYNRGSLYRFATDARPILKVLELEQEGQLFVDMKDFSRKTLKIKEIAMADFMKEHFYLPILKAASRYSAGSGLSEDDRGIKLTNMPGDAAIFTGSLTYLVALAKDIQQVIRSYRQQLATKLPPTKSEEMLDDIHAKYKKRKEELKTERKEVAEKMARDEKGAEVLLIALGEEEHRLEDTYRRDLEAAIKSELEAGLYISYGSKAETTVLPAMDDFTAPVQVAIGEKINEAARGTYRNSFVWAKLEVLLRSEKLKTKNPSLRYPFDIYIDRTYSIKMPPELEKAFEKMVASRKLANAEALAKIVSDEFLNDLKSLVAGEPYSSLRLISSGTDLYNKGQALSEEALEAYMKDNRGAKRFFKKTVAVKDLAPPIRGSFFLPVDPLELWFGIESRKGKESIEAFYRCGDIIFKGFESNTPIPVWEIIDTENDFFLALKKHHIEDWFNEVKSKKADEAAGTF
jgi:hypothetical protein